MPDARPRNRNYPGDRLSRKTGGPVFAIERHRSAVVRLRVSGGNGSTREAELLPRYPPRGYSVRG